MSDMITFSARYSWLLARLRAIGLILAASLGFLATGAVVLATGLPNGAAYMAGEVCFATFNDTTVYSSTDASAVQNAVSAAGEGATVKVAGTCAGVQTIGGAAQTVAITKALTLAGGYTTTNWITSYPLTQPTTLDARGLGRVINANAAAMTTTFTVRDLKIQNGVYNQSGAGLFANRPMTLTGVIVYSNTVTGLSMNGGGAYFLQSAYVADSTFQNNTASGWAGGAAFSAGNINRVTGTTFLSNTATTYGGGAFSAGAISITNVTFAGNVSSGDGGGLYIWWDGAAAMSGVTFSGNTCTNLGGGAYLGGKTHLLSAAFMGNRAGQDGGGAYLVSSVYVTNTVFTNNRASQNGGGVYFQNSDVGTNQLVNVLLASNTAQSGQGAAIYASHNGGNDTLTLRHTTIVSATPGSGSAIYVVAGTANLTNTIIANYAIGLARGGGTLQEDYTLFDGITTPYQGGVSAGTHSLTGTAAFANTTWYTLTAASAAIDVGVGVGIGTDYFGTPRPRGAGYDLGYAESPYARQCYATSNNGATVYASASASAVQTAVSAASAGATVKVAGTCIGVQKIGTLTQTVAITKVLTLAGGYTTTNWITSYPLTQPTTLDAQSAGRVIYATAPISLQNLIVQNGRWTIAEYRGGGIYAAQPAILSGVKVYSSTIAGSGTNCSGGGAYFAEVATIVSSTFQSNATVAGSGSICHGGGTYFNKTAQVRNSSFQGNSSNYSGGGAYFNSAAQILNSNFSNNTSAYSGAGLYAWGGQTSVAGTAFSGNVASNGSGGGAYMDYASVTSCVFSGNQSRPNGGGGGLASSIAVISDTTFSNNAAYWEGGGVRAAKATIIRSIFVGNSVSSNVNISRGGGVHAATVDVSSSTFRSNSATAAGGAIYLTGNGSAGQSELVNVLFTANAVEGNRPGAALYAENQGGDDVVNFRHVTIASPTTRNNVAVHVVSGTVNLTNTIVASYTIGLAATGGTIREDYTLFDAVSTPYQGQVITGAHSLTGVARFYDTTSYTLTLGSAAIDSGANAGVTVDFEGDTRPRGDGFDIGYDEYRFVDYPCLVEYTGDKLTDLGSFDASAVQAAVSAAGPGRTIKVAGTCAGVQTIGGLTQSVAITKALTLAGGYTRTNWLVSYPLTQPTTLNAQGAGRVIYATGAAAEALTLHNLTLRNGNWQVSGQNGGGIYSSQAITLSGVNVFSSTVVNRGGGGYFAATALVTNTTFSGNTSGSIGGGAVFNAAATVASANFANNVAGWSGGGAVFYGTTRVDRTTFVGNRGQWVGGGAFFSGGATIVRTTFANNSVTAPGGDGGGADLGSASTVVDSIFRGNTAAHRGGGLSTSAAVVITNTLFANNGAADGGGFRFYDDATRYLVNVLFTANTASSGSGAAVYAEAGTASLYHLTIGSPTPRTGASVYVQGGTVNLVNTIVASYTVGFQRSGGILNEDYTLFSGVATPYIGAVASGGHSITGTAAFAYPATEDYRLITGSGALDAGTDVGVTTDYFGNVRPIGPGYDIGYAEGETVYYIITPTAGINGSILPSMPQNVAAGENITFTIMPDSGYHIADVQVDGVSRGTPTAYAFMNVVANHTISASFAKDITPRLFLPCILR